MPHRYGLGRILEDQGFRPAKGLGQNFLVDRSVVRRIVDAVHALPGDSVLEIGPGLGALTVPLAQAGANVSAVEVDERLRRPLEARLPEGVRLVIGDALALDWREVSPGALEDTLVVSNLPYGITSPLIIKLLSAPFGRAILMVQSEVAERMTAGAGRRERGSLTLLVESRSKVRRLFDVRPEAFFPRPKVASSVLELAPSHPPVHTRSEEVWKGLFSYRRKTLRRGLREAFGLSSEGSAEVLRQAGVREAARPEDLSLDDFSRLASSLFPFH